MSSRNPKGIGAVEGGGKTISARDLVFGNYRVSGQNPYQIAVNVGYDYDAISKTNHTDISTIGDAARQYVPAVATSMNDTISADKVSGCIRKQKSPFESEGNVSLEHQASAIDAYVDSFVVNEGKINVKFKVKIV